MIFVRRLLANMFPKLRFVLIDCRPFSDHLKKAEQCEMCLKSIEPCWQFSGRVDVWAFIPAPAGCQRAAADRWSGQDVILGFSIIFAPQVRDDDPMAFRIQCEEKYFTDETAAEFEHHDGDSLSSLPEIAATLNAAMRVRRHLRHPFHLGCQDEQRCRSLAPIYESRGRNVGLGIATAQGGGRRLSQLLGRNEQIT